MKFKLFIAAALTLVASTSLADRVTMSNGTTIEGRIVSRDDRFLQVDTGGLIMRLDVSSVTAITKSEDHENTLLRAVTSLRRRNIVEGIDLLFLARREGAPDKGISRILVENDSRVTQAIERARDDEKSDLRRALRRMAESGALDYESLYDFSHHLFSLGDVGGAVAAMGRIDHEKTMNDPVLREWALELLKEQVGTQIGQGDFQDALVTVESMRRLGATSDDPQFPLAHLSRSAEARERGQYSEAIRILIEDLQPLVPEIARNRVIYTLESLKRWATETGKFDEAREAIAPLEPLYPLLYKSVLDHLTKQHVQRYLNEGNPTAALELFEIYPEGEVPEELRDIYNVAYNDMRLRELDESEPLELLKHGRWAAENGLLEQAILIFNRTRENPNLREVSDRLLINARSEYDIQLMDEAQRLYSQGDMIGTRQRTLSIIQNQNRGSHLRREAERLDQLALTAIDREEELRGPRAEVNFQQAERAFFTQDFEQSLVYINVVLSSFPDTPAAARAAQLLPDVVRALEISYLEGRTKTLPDVSAKFNLEQMQQSDRLGQEVRRLLDSMNKS